MIYLIDTSALHRLDNDAELRRAWEPLIEDGAIASCYPQRAEYLYSARSAKNFRQRSDMLANHYRDVAVPKRAGSWIGQMQALMAEYGCLRSASAIDLLVAATAVHHHLTVLHDDNDFRTIGRISADVAEHPIRVHQLPHE